MHLFGITPLFVTGIWDKIGAGKSALFLCFLPDRYLAMTQASLIIDVPLSLTRTTYNPEQEQDFYEKSISPHTRKAYLALRWQFGKIIR